MVSHLRLPGTMTNLLVMHNVKCVQNLSRNFFGDCFLRFPMFSNVLRQIALLDIFHSKIRGVGILEPTKKLDEERRILTAG